MTFAIAITAFAVFACGACAGVLAVVVAGIRSEDRAGTLTRPPRTRGEAVTRRLLGAATRGYQARHDPAPCPPPGGDLP